MRILVSGRVQGVGYRFFARSKAEALGIRGFVRNLPDGRVEAVAVGPADQVNQFVAELRAGPIGGRVRDCQTSPIQRTGNYRGFTIEY